MVSVVNPTVQRFLSAIPVREESPLPMQRREPSGIPEKMAKFMELAEQRRNMPNGGVDTSWSRARASVPGVTNELPPAYDGNSRADNHVSKLHTEIKLNGKTIARVYNSGVSEIADDYAFLARGFSEDKITGPDLAESRVARIKAALGGPGVTVNDNSVANGPAVAKRPGASVVDILRASTAQTQQEWLAFKATEPPHPGELLSRMV